MTTCTKANIAEAIVSRNSCTKKQAFYILESLFEIMKATLASGDDILISGFGKFCVKDKAEGGAGIQQPVRSCHLQPVGW
jgi:integration host factor subunit alpha